MRLNFLIALFVVLAILLGCEKLRVAEKPAATDAYSLLKNTVCDKQITLLGEGNSHDEGATNAFKSRMARDLIADCGFSLIIFESSFYQFVNLNRDLSAVQQITRDEINASIGGLWAHQIEIDPLVKFLTEVANDRKVIIAGMDDQIGGRGQDYSNFGLPVELTEGLEIEQREACRAAINKHIYWAYTKIDRYDADKKQFILSCLKGPDTPEDAQLAAMRASLIRDFQRDLLEGDARYTGRANSMYENFEYWYDGQDRPKTIIWTATVHAAKTGRLSPSFGQLIQRRFGDEAYTAGFSALSGTRGRPGRAAKPLPEAPEISIEAMIFQDNEADILFVDSDALAAFGDSPAAAISNTYEARNWAAELDGLIVFRTQYPPTLMPAPVE